LIAWSFLYWNALPVYVKLVAGVATVPRVLIAWYVGPAVLAAVDVELMRIGVEYAAVHAATDEHQVVDGLVDRARP
jgi:hypothetical protein